MTDATQSVGIRLDPRETTVVITGADGRARTQHVPSRLAVTKDGLVVGHDATPYRGQRPVERAALVDVNDGGDEQAARNQPLAVFLSEVCRSVGLGDEHDCQLDASTQDTESTDTATVQTVGQVVISVPGHYTAGKRRSVARATEAAGLPSPELLRRPTPAIRAAQTDAASVCLECGDSALAVDIDSACLAVAMYTRSDTGEVTVERRKISDRVGSQEWRTRLSDAVLERAGRNRNAVVEYDDHARTDTATAIGQVVRAHPEPCIDGELEVALELVEGATLRTDGHVLSETVPITETVDPALRYSALDGYTDELVAVLQRVLEDAGVTTVDHLFLTGDGVTLDVIRNAARDVVDSRGEIHAAGTRSVSRLLSEPSPDSMRAVTETLDHRLRLKAHGADGPTARTVSCSLPATGDSWMQRLEPLEPTQQYGQVVLEWADPITGTVEATEPLAITDVPPGEDVQVRVRVAVHGAGDTTVSATALSGDEPEREVPVDRTRVDDGTWLAFAGTDTDEIEAGANVDASSHSRRTDSSGEADTDDEDVAEIVWDVRTELWKRGIVAEKPLESRQIESLIREFDQRLSLCGIEFFEPEVGIEANSRKHYVREQRPTDQPEGTILEVLKPGLVVEDRVVKRADVVIAAPE